MQFSVKPKRWEIESSDVSALDRQRVKVNELCERLIAQDDGRFHANPCVSSTTVNRLGKSLASLRRNLSGPHRAREQFHLFDQLIIADVKANAEVVQAYYDYFHNLDSNLKLGGCISGIFGRKAYSNLVDFLKPDQFPHKEEDRFSELMHQAVAGRLEAEVIMKSERTPEIQKLRGRFMELLVKYKGATEDMYKAAGILNEVSEWNVELAPDVFDFSFWQGNFLYAAVNPDKIYCYKSFSDKEPKFLDVLVPGILFHELGHGLHDMLSHETMPAGLSPELHQHVPFVHGIGSEGIALHMEDVGADYSKSHRKRMGFSKRDIEIENLYRSVYIAQKMQKAMYHVFNVQERHQQDSDMPEELQRSAEEMLSKSTGLKLFRSDPLCGVVGEDKPLTDAFGEFIYFFGQRRASKLVGELRGDKVPEPLVAQALMTGYWCSADAQERFVRELWLPYAREQAS